MKQKEILEYNKRCAEFLGAIDSKHTWGYMLKEDELNLSFALFDEKIFSNDGGGSGWLIKDLKFHSDWNWIMEVVEAIEKLDNSKYEVTILESECAIIDKQAAENEENPFMIKPIAACFKANSKKEAVVQAINKFLIWYNEKNK